MTAIDLYNSPFFHFALGMSLLLPLVSFLIAFSISEKYSWIVSFTSPFLLLLNFLSSTYIFFNVWGNDPYTLQWQWFSINNHIIHASIILQNITVLMLWLITFVSFLVHVYSIGYMAGERAIRRYFAMLGFFTFSMLGIVLSDDLLIIFIFWELVGFSSYMLIGHFKEKPLAAAAAKKAFIMNRIGDAGFIVGLMIVWSNAETFNLTTLSQLDFTNWQTVASLCLFCGIMGKSAQFPLLTWLPDAMEGPTPVSALIHAATMVAAGVFLLARVQFLFSPVALDVVAVVGIITALAGALSALVQTDVKKILAYSTISQLGLMVTTAGTGHADIAMFHLFTHAFFKACLFLCAGSIIHSLHQAQHEAHINFDVQDIRNLGGLRKKLSFTHIAMIVSGSALAGLPFSSGFLSKEAIYTSLLEWKGDAFSFRWIIVAAVFIVSFLTVLYIFRMVYYIFWSDEKKTKDLTITEPPAVMRGPVALLAVGSLWFTVSANPFNFSGWLLSADAHHPWLMIASVIWIALALFVSFYMFKDKKPFTSALLLNNFYFDYLYQALFTHKTLQLATASYRFDRKVIDGFIHTVAYVHVTTAHVIGWFDRVVIDGIVKGIAALSRSIGSFTRSFQSGKIQLYVFWSIFATIIFIIWALF